VAKDVGNGSGIDAGGSDLVAPWAPLVVRRLHNYSYEETEQAVSDSLALRQFCRVYLNRVPDDTTLIRWANLIQPKTLEKFNERITQLALEHKVTKGRKLRKAAHGWNGGGDEHSCAL